MGNRGRIARGPRRHLNVRVPLPHSEHLETEARLRGMSVSDYITMRICQIEDLEIPFIERKRRLEGDPPIPVKT